MYIYIYILYVYIYIYITRIRSVLYGFRFLSYVKYYVLSENK